MVILKESMQNGNTFRELIRAPINVISNFQIKGQKKCYGSLNNSDYVTWYT